MSIFSPIIQVFTWFKKQFVDHTKSGASVAVVITETAKAILENPVVGFLANVLDGITHTNLPTQAVTLINNQIPKILATELAIQGLPDNPTPDQILEFEQSIIKAFGVKESDNGKLYTVLASQIYGIIQNTVNNTQGKFADWVIAVEAAYQDYQVDVKLYANMVNAPVGTVLPDGNTVLETAEQGVADLKAGK